MPESTDEPDFTLDNVKISSESREWKLDAWKFIPKGKSASHPVIIMAHGISANKQMGLARFAEVFVKAGYACVVFDYRRWGDSDGTPRNCLYVTEQLEDYRSVVKWVRERPREFDVDKIVLWGTSFSGGHIVSLAAERHINAACAIGQCPYVGKSGSLALCAKLKLAAYGVADLLRQAVGMSPLYIPVVAPAGQLCALSSEDSIAGMIRLVEDKRHYPNQISASSILQLPFYNPAATASKIRCPILLIIPETDLLCPPEYALDVVKSAPQGRMARIVGGHFDLYPGSPGFDACVAAELEFLKKHVPVP